LQLQNSRGKYFWKIYQKKIVFIKVMHMVEKYAFISPIEMAVTRSQATHTG
jgi:hypothetical protein